jgi:hypothetical protein
MKIRPVGAEFFHVDGRTDMVKLIVAFRNFANSSNNDAKAGVPVLSPRNVYYTYEHNERKGAKDKNSKNKQFS